MSVFFFNPILVTLRSGALSRIHSSLTSLASIPSIDRLLHRLDPRAVGSVLIRRHKADHRHAADPFVKPFGIHRRSRLLLRMLQPTLPPLQIHLHLRTSYPRWYNPSRVVSIVPAASNDTFHSASIRLSIAIPYGLLLSSVAIVFPGTISIKCWRDPSSC